MTDAYDDIIREAAATYSVPFAWIKAVIGTESGFDPDAYRAEPQIDDASYGLMQLLYRTAQGLGYSGPPEGLFEPRTNIMLGAKLLGQLVSRYGMDFEKVYSAYNSGSPTKYLTSSQVARHVANARAWLERVGGAAAEVAASNPFLVMAGIFLLYYLLGGSRK